MAFKPLSGAAQAAALLLLLLCLGSVSTVSLRAQAPSQDALALLLGGTWSHEPPEGGLCKSPFWWEVDAAGQRLTVHLSEPIRSRDSFGDTFHYDLLRREGGRLFMFMHHETLRADDGTLVRWHLIFEGADRYVWVRADHPEGWRQGETYRCPLTG